MSDKPVSEISWLALGPADATPQVSAIFDRTTQRFGHIRNAQLVTAHRPELATAQDALSKAVQFAPDTGITPFERELLAIVVSAENHCPACLFAHSAILREITEDPVLVGRIEVNYRHAELTPRQRALADYAVKVTRASWELDPTDLDKLRAEGLSEIEIIDAAAVIAYFNFSNRLNNALGIAPNAEAYLANRS
ncbi:peroxidase-related enzyme [Agrobacterium sp. AGB01]|uniref:peroxidase-related enzyme n=1 Tax=Agrobacterium sp. AGB01 TaxID=2769302 RepID=UPI00177AB0BD|nr:peroxidase-related enzyme [Agrobacterium sp. AGB01]MBD9388543.1 peroxidase-related enzyme [Agrobacterium sp. AGB01]